MIIVVILIMVETNILAILIIIITITIDIAIIMMIMVLTIITTMMAIMVGMIMVGVHGDHSGIARGPPKIMSRMHMTSMIIVMMQQINESLQDLCI